MQEALWVFGYGSLIWNPGFPAEHTEVARLDGWHRSFCMISVHYRGTPEQPGLVLALDRAEGAVCEGVAFRVAQGAEQTVLDYLRARELVSSAYLEARLPVTLAGGARVEAVTYVIDPDHAQYRGGLALTEQAGIIADAIGDNGSNRDYLFNTTDHLRKLGIADADLDWLSAELRARG